MRTLNEKPLSMSESQIQGSVLEILRIVTEQKIEHAMGHRIFSQCVDLKFFFVTPLFLEMMMTLFLNR